MEKHSIFRKIEVLKNMRRKNSENYSSIKIFRKDEDKIFVKLPYNSVYIKKSIKGYRWDTMDFKEIKV